MIKPLIILGFGGYGRTVADVAEQLGYSPITILDDANPDQPLSKYKSCLALPYVEFVVAFGNNEFRLQWCEKITSAGGKLATLIHPTAYISPKAVINEGSVILPHAVVNTDVVIERGCIINLSAIIDHGCIIEEGCHICLAAIVKGENKIPKCSKIEAGEVVERGQYPLRETV